jgi:hypothetical protein
MPWWAITGTGVLGIATVVWWWFPKWLADSEIMTIVVLYHSSHSKTSRRSMRASSSLCCAWPFQKRPAMSASSP